MVTLARSRRDDEPTHKHATTDESMNQDYRATIRIKLIGSDDELLTDQPVDPTELQKELEDPEPSLEWKNENLSGSRRETFDELVERLRTSGWEDIARAMENGDPVEIPDEALDESSFRRQSPPEYLAQDTLSISTMEVLAANCAEFNTEPTHALYALCEDQPNIINTFETGIIQHMDHPDSVTIRAQRTVDPWNSMEFKSQLAEVEKEYGTAAQSDSLSSELGVVDNSGDPVMDPESIKSRIGTDDFSIDVSQTEGSVLINVERRETFDELLGRFRENGYGEVAETLAAGDPTEVPSEAFQFNPGPTLRITSETEVPFGSEAHKVGRRFSDVEGPEELTAALRTIFDGDADFIVAFEKEILPLL